MSWIDLIELYKTQVQWEHICFYTSFLYNMQFSGYSNQIEVLWSKGEKPLPPLHPLLIKGRNLYRLKTLRQVCNIKNKFSFSQSSVNCIELINWVVVNFRDGKMKERDRKFWWTSTLGGLLQGLIEKHESKRRKIGKCSRRIGTTLFELHTGRMLFVFY